MFWKFLKSLICVCFKPWFWRKHLSAVNNSSSDRDCFLAQTGIVLTIDLLRINIRKIVLDKHNAITNLVNIILNTYWGEEDEDLEGEYREDEDEDEDEDSNSIASGGWSSLYY